MRISIKLSTVAAALFLGLPLILSPAQAASPTYNKLATCATNLGGGTTVEDIVLMAGKTRVSQLRTTNVELLASGQTVDRTFVEQGSPLLLCGTAGAEAVNNLATGDVFLGGGGIDYVNTLGSGQVFWGMAGADVVTGTLSLGTFNGGDGNDNVSLQTGGTYNGNGGDDTISNYSGGGTLSGGAFTGGAGSDSVIYMAASTYATFNGGADADTVQEITGPGLINGGDGNDVVGLVNNANATFDGQGGNDSLTTLQLGTFNNGETLTTYIAGTCNPSITTSGATCTSS